MYIYIFFALVFNIPAKFMRIARELFLNYIETPKILENLLYFD